MLVHLSILKQCGDGLPDAAWAMRPTDIGLLRM